MLSDRIKQARKEAGLSQIALADRLRATGDPRFAATDYKRVGGWENGSPRLAFHVVEAIAHVTGKPLEFFAERETPTPLAEPVPDLGFVEEVEELARDARVLADRLRRQRRNAG
jgi:transcriptional regulator with XRE-family HTH domain